MTVNPDMPRNIDWVTPAEFECLRKALIKYEDLRLKLYKCSAGMMTIAVGRNLEARGVSHDEAMLMLDNDIKEAISSVPHRDIWRGLDDVRQLVLIRMCFNLGHNRLKGFKKMWAALRQRNYQLAAAEMLDSKWAKQVHGRSIILARIMETGELFPGK